MQIKHLERILGLPLLESVGRTVKLTEPGIVVDQYAIEVLNQVNHLADAVIEMRGVDGGRLTVAADTTVGIYVMPPLLGAWHREFTHVDIDLRVGNHDTICQLLRANEVDFAVVSTVPDLADLVWSEYLPNRLVVIAASDHPLVVESPRGPLPVSILANEPILVREGGSSTSAAVDSYCRTLGLKPRVAMRLGSIGAIKQGVTSGLGLAIVSDRAIRNELAVGSLVVLDVEGFPLELMWYIVHFRGKRLSPSARSFIAYLESGRNAQQPHAGQAAGSAIRKPAAPRRGRVRRGPAVAARLDG